MLLSANKDEKTYELVPAQENDADTVSLYGYPYKRVEIDKSVLNKRIGKSN